MYYKEINGRVVFSDCKTIQLEYDHPPMKKGQYISNPSVELLTSEGWLQYVPPQVEPQPMTEPDEFEIIQAVKRMLSSSVVELSDEDALAVAALYPTWISKVGEQVNAGERYWYNEKLYKVVQTHTVQEDWTPDVSTSLFTEVTVDPWPEWRQPTGAQDAYMIGDQVTFEGTHYVSLIDNNTWSPAAYPQGWEERP